MLPRLRGAGRPSPRVAFVVVPVVLGALLLLAGDRPSTGMSRLEATQGAVPEPLPADDPTTSTAPAPPPAPAGDGAATAPALPTDPVGPSPLASTALEPATTVVASTPLPAAATSGETVMSAPSTTTTSTVTVPKTTTTTATTAAPRSGPARSPGVESDVVPLTNQDRTTGGLGRLSRNSCLDAVASGYAEQLARSGVLAHNPAAGSAVAECRPGAAWGDNVGTAAPCSAAVLEEKWMASPGHRHNILTGAFQYIGVGAWTDTAGACWVQVLFSS